MVSDESQSRDWQLSEPVAGCSNGTGSLTDEPQFAAEKMLESDVRQFGNISADVAESSIDDYSNKCERSDVTESPQLLNRCMLSGFDVSSTNSDPNISVGSADISTDAELNDARLSASDGDSSVNSTLKGSDVEESCPEHSSADVNTLQPTFSVSIPISTMFETETKKDENADIGSANVKSSSGCEAVREVYSPISDASNETTSCQSPVPNSPPVREFSPISPFTPRPNASDTPLPVVPLYWSHDVSSLSSAVAVSPWDTCASLPPSLDVGKTQQYHSDVTESASESLRDNNFTFMHYSGQSRLNHGGLVIGTPARHCQNVSFEQQPTGVLPHHQSENRYPFHVLPCDQHQSHLQQHYMHYVDDKMLAHSSYSAHSQKQNAGSSVDAGKHNVTRPASSLRESSSESDRFTIAAHPDMRSEQAVSSVGHLSSVTGQAHISDCDGFDRMQVHHSASTSINSIG